MSTATAPSTLASVHRRPRPPKALIWTRWSAPTASICHARHRRRAGRSPISSGICDWTDELTVLTCSDPAEFRAATSSSCRRRRRCPRAIEVRRTPWAGTSRGGTPGPVADRAGRRPRWRWAECRPGPGWTGSVRRWAPAPWPAPGSWRPGRTGRTLPTRSASTGHRPIGCGMSPISVSATSDHAFRHPRVCRTRIRFRVELTAPSGVSGSWGPPDCRSRPSADPRWTSPCWSPSDGTRDDLALTAIGPAAEQWLTIAQAFAGAPGPAGAAGYSGRG